MKKTSDSIMTWMKDHRFITALLIVLIVYRFGYLCGKVLYHVIG